jgi:trehalose/maltose hydrolase-like predicted phosphorylase
MPARAGARPGAHGPDGVVFALSNGHVGVRENLDEDELYDKPGTFLSGFTRACAAHPEGGYGNPVTEVIKRGDAISRWYSSGV